MRLGILAGDENRILGVARGMVGRKIQRLEVVVVGLDLGSFFDGVAEIAEDADDLVHCLDDWMLGTDGTADAGEGDVEPLGRQSP